MSTAGDTWNCDQCGKENATESWPCESCRYPLVHQAGGAPKHVKGEYTEDVTARERNADISKWSCSHCKFLNAPEAERCEKCYALKDAAKAFQERAKTTSIKLRRSMENLRPLLAKSSQGNNFETDELKEQVPQKGDKWRDISNALFRDEPLQESVMVKDLLDAPNASDIAGSIVLHNNDVDRSVSGVLFRVLAPNAEKVAVVGEWNQWNPFEDYMYRETDDYWQTVVPEARPGQLYNYIVQFWDEEQGKTVSVFRADPRGQVLRFENGRWCSEVYDLKAFRWTDRKHRMPKHNQLIMYELHVGTFGLEGCGQHLEHEALERIGTFQDVIAKLPDLVELGINCLALMPITQDSHMAPFNCWGYDPVSLFAVHTDYGSPDDLKQLINACHMRGVSVVFDFVPNHMSCENILSYFDGPADLYFPSDDRLKCTDWGPRPNFASPRVRRHIVDAVEFWLRDFHFDGVRVDSTCSVRMYSYFGQKNILPDGYILLQEMNDMVHRKYPQKISIAEDLQDPWSMCNHGGAGFDMQWDEKFFKEVLRVVIATSDKHRDMHALAHGICDPVLHGSLAGGRVIYTESHDTVPLDRQGRIPSAILRGHRTDWPDCRDVESNFFSLKRTALALAILLTSPGIPMLLQGQEIFETCAPEWPHGPMVDHERRERMDPLDGFQRLVSRLCDLRLNLAHTTAGLTGYYARAYHINNTENKVIAYHRWVKGGATDDVIVIVNCSNVDYEEYYLGFPRFGEWHLRFNSDSQEYSRSFPEYENLKVVETYKDPKDGYPFCGRVRIAAYTVLVYSQDALSTVQFTLDADIDEDDRLYLTGSVPALGIWDIHDAVEMRAAGRHDDDSLWKTSPLALSFGQQIEFKFFLVNGEGPITKQRVRWQVGDNNTFRADNSNRRYRVDCTNITFDE